MGVNKVILVGNLGKDPELRYTTNQTPVCSFSLATGERKKDATGAWVDHTEWHNIICFNKTAENCSNYMKKGSQCYIEGKIQTRKWQDKNGNDRYTTEIVANTVQFLGAKSGGGINSRVESSSSNSNSFDEMAASVSTAATTTSSPDEVSFDEDDIPF